MACLPFVVLVAVLSVPVWVVISLVGLPGWLAPLLVLAAIFLVLAPIQWLFPKRRD